MFGAFCQRRVGGGDCNWTTTTPVEISPRCRPGGAVHGLLRTTGVTSVKKKMAFKYQQFTPQGAAWSKQKDPPLVKSLNQVHFSLNFLVTIHTSCGQFVFKKRPKHFTINQAHCVLTVCLAGNHH